MKIRVIRVLRSITRLNTPYINIGVVEHTSKGPRAVWGVAGEDEELCRKLLREFLNGESQ